MDLEKTNNRTRKMVRCKQCMKISSFWPIIVIRKCAKKNPPFSVTAWRDTY